MEKYFLFCTEINYELPHPRICAHGYYKFCVKNIRELDPNEKFTKLFILEIKPVYGILYTCTCVLLYVHARIKLDN